MRPFIMSLIKAVPAKQNGQDGFLMTYNLPVEQVPVLDEDGAPVIDELGSVLMTAAPSPIENPQWIPKANMEMLQTVSGDSAKAVIAAALAAGTAS